MQHSFIWSKLCLHWHSLVTVTGREVHFVHRVFMHCYSCMTCMVSVAVINSSNYMTKGCNSHIKKKIFSARQRF